MEVKAFLAKWILPFGPWAFFWGALTMLQISEYGFAEFGLALAIALVIFHATLIPFSKNTRIIYGVVGALVNMLFMVVIYRSKADSAWSILLEPKEQFKVSIGVGDDEGAWNRYFFYQYADGSLGKTVSPINVFMTATIVNTARFPIRVVGYSARIKGDDGWFTSWQPATVVSGGTVVMSAGKDPYKLTLENMKTVVPGLPMLSFLSEGQSQIEASRTLQGWFALEYPDHLLADKNHKIELEVVSDVAGVAHGIIDWAKVKDPHDPTSVPTTPTALYFPQTLNLSGARFMYWSDIQQQLKATR